MIGKGSQIFFCTIKCLGEKAPSVFAWDIKGSQTFLQGRFTVNECFDESCTRILRFIYLNCDMVVGCFECVVVECL